MTVICQQSVIIMMKTLTEEIDHVMSELGEPPLRREGHRSGSWVLLDFGCVIVHVFMDEARKFYDLERLWSDAENVDLSDVLTEN
jgi:ribosome-associated protein